MRQCIAAVSMMMGAERKHVAIVMQGSYCRHSTLFSATLCGMGMLAAGMMSGLMVSAAAAASCCCSTASGVPGLALPAPAVITHIMSVM